MTELRNTKAVSSVVIQPTFSPSAKPAKAVGVVVLQAPYTPDIELKKSVGVVVVQDSSLFTRALLNKSVGVVVVQPESSGHARQETAADRPTYRTSPIPHVEFGAGDSLSVNIVLPASYTLIRLAPTGTFTVEAITLSSGPFTLPAVNFNQVVLARGVLDRRAIRRIKASMRLRAGL